MLILFALLGAIAGVALVVMATYEKMPYWILCGLLGNMFHSIGFLFRTMS